MSGSDDGSMVVTLPSVNMYTKRSDQVSSGVILFHTMHSERRDNQGGEKDEREKMQRETRPSDNIDASNVPRNTVATSSVQDINTSRITISRIGKPLNRNYSPRRSNYKAYNITVIDSIPCYHTSKTDANAQKQAESVHTNAINNIGDSVIDGSAFDGNNEGKRWVLVGTSSGLMRLHLIDLKKMSKDT